MCGSFLETLCDGADAKPIIKVWNPVERCDWSLQSLPWDDDSAAGLEPAAPRHALDLAVAEKGLE